MLMTMGWLVVVFLAGVMIGWWVGATLTRSDKYQQGYFDGLEDGAAEQRYADRLREDGEIA